MKYLRKYLFLMHAGEFNFEIFLIKMNFDDSLFEEDDSATKKEKKEQCPYSVKLQESRVSVKSIKHEKINCFYARILNLLTLKQMQHSLFPYCCPFECNSCFRVYNVSTI